MRYTVTVSQLVDIDLDESKFTPEFIEEYKNSFYPYTDIEDHAGHLAQLCARGLLGEFVEGYGTAKDFGIKAEVVDSDISVLWKQED